MFPELLLVPLAVFHSSCQLSCPTNETANITSCLKTAEGCVKITRFIDAVAETFSPLQWRLNINIIIIETTLFLLLLLSDTLDTDKKTLISFSFFRFFFNKY